MTTAFDLGCFAANAFIEKAAKESKEPYDIQQIGTQQYLPINARREFSPEEQERIEKGKSRWFPQIFQSYATDPADTMASPTKSGLLTGLLGAGVGGLAGAHLGSMAGGDRPSLGGAGIGGLLGAGAGGLIGGLGGMWNRQASNDTTEELMRRLPPGARMRDIESDPVYQRDIDRSHDSSRTAAMIAAMQAMR